MVVDTRECGFLGCGDDLCADTCAGICDIELTERKTVMEQMRVIPDHPVPDDKVGESHGLDYFLIPENVKDDFSVTYEKMGDGHIYKAPPPIVKPEPHECRPPKFEHNEVFQYPLEWIESTQKVPNDSFWVCDTCYTKFMARSRVKVGLGYKRRWAKMRWFSFIVKHKWNRLHGMEG